ncbi:long-chain acyl-CoA synthetase [Alteromonadaceae bacterium Bs31]|nr:long-chain acyl-CoA synthetase [Alteromonadaceae bacterium Bs31]
MQSNQVQQGEVFPRYQNVNEMLKHAFDNYKGLPSYTGLDYTLSYSDLDTLSARFASFLRHELGLKEGERLAIQLPNILQFPVVFYGAIRAGIVIVNVNPLYTAREIKYQLCDSGAKALVVLSNIAQNAAAIIEETNVQKVIVTNVADLHPFPKRSLINFVVKYIKKAVKPFKFKNAIALRKALSYPLKPFPEPTPNNETLLILQYTGGTTGISKGAMLSHGNMTSNVWQMSTHMPDAFVEGKEVFVACLPLYHIYALNLHALAAFARGEHNLLIPNPRDLAATVKVLSKYAFTVFVGINTLFTALCRFEPFKTLNFSKLKITSAGGMALTEDAANAWQAITACDVCEGYGLTETSPVVCGNFSYDIRRGTVGVPLPETEVKLIDADGNTVRGESGELCVRGPQVMQAYWNNEAETQKVLDSEGWFKTGDIAEIDEEGLIKIVDRKKDMILVSGFNVYPNEIEDIVTKMDCVVEAAAVGIKSEKCGELVKLFVVPSASSVSKDTIMAYCRKNLTPYKVPKTIEFRDSLPKSNVGKILRKELRE